VETHERRDFCNAEFMRPEFSDEQQAVVGDDPDIQRAGHAAKGIGPTAGMTTAGSEAYFRDFHQQLRWNFLR
jgi:hypothetical protein